MPVTAQQSAAISEALDRLVTWPDLARSPQLSKFLQHIVEHTVEGHGSSIKAYTIAVDVFGRPPDFDPQSDPIVRVQARRLRALLDQYYTEAGRDDPVQIRLPVGRYVPEFVWIEREPDIAVPAASDAAPPRRNMSRIWLVWAGVTLVLAVAAISYSLWQPAAPGVTSLLPPSISIAEFADLTDGAGPPVAGLAIELVTDLEQFEDLDVHYVGGDLAPVQVEPEARDNFALTGTVRLVGSDFQYEAYLTDRTSTRVVWNSTASIPRSASNHAGILDTISRDLTLALASPRGPLHADVRALILSGRTLETPTNLYMCRMVFAFYRETTNATDAARAGRCLSDLPQSDADSAIALAIRGSLKAEQADLATEPTALATTYAAAMDDLNRAINLASISGFVWEQHARLRETMGEPVMALSDYGSALQLNPASTDALAAYARLLVWRGALNEARPIIASALAGEPNPPNWYLGTPALLALAAKDYATALPLAEKYRTADKELGAILTLIAGHAAGHPAATQATLQQVLQTASFRAQGILPRLEQKITDPQLVETISQGLVAAGVPETALRQPF